MNKVLEARKAYFDAVKNIELTIVSEEKELTLSFLEQYPDSIVHEISFYYPVQVVARATLLNNKTWHLYTLTSNGTWERWS